MRQALSLNTFAIRILCITGMSLGAPNLALAGCDDDLKADTPSFRTLLIQASQGDISVLSNPAVHNGTITPQQEIQIHRRLVTTNALEYLVSRAFPKPHSVDELLEFLKAYSGVAPHIIAPPSIRFIADQTPKTLSGLLLSEVFFDLPQAVVQNAQSSLDLVGYMLGIRLDPRTLKKVPEDDLAILYSNATALYQILGFPLLNSVSFDPLILRDPYWSLFLENLSRLVDSLMELPNPRESWNLDPFKNQLDREGLRAENIHRLKKNGIRRPVKIIYSPPANKPPLH